MLFISHSSDDLRIVEALVDLFRSSLGLPPDRIRCSSLGGYRLPAAVSIDEQLRREIHEAEAFVCLISPRSLRSMYVVFELGARWGTGKPIIPLLAPGVAPRVLQPPLSAFQALSCESAASLHQLVTDLATVLHVHLYPAPTYQREVERILALPPAPAEVHVPQYLQRALAQDFDEREEQLSRSQRALLEYLKAEYLAAEPKRRDGIPQSDFNEKFGAQFKSVYWRLESLCFLGFIDKEVTERMGEIPRYTYRLSAEYKSWLEPARRSDLHGLA
jgi:TIR domain